MNVLIISSLFPPYVMGGAEMAAHSLAVWLARQGHRVHVLTGAPTPAAIGIEDLEEGLCVERRFFPNFYPIYQAGETRTWRKLLWHARDHFNPASEAIVKDVIERVRPDLVNLHDLQGIGYNLLREVGRQGLPCVQVLHDFGFLCINMNMFLHGRVCPHRHFSCMASGALKRSYLSSIERLAFWSPTRALMERHRPHLPRHLELFSNPYPLLFSEAAQSPPRPAAAPARLLRLLYVGQVTPPKGVGFLIDVLASLRTAAAHSTAGDADFQLTVLGDGELLAPLQKQHGNARWVRFPGRVPPEAVAEFMAESDLLLVPSLWFENSPLVARQAIQMGLPIVASNIGGLPELVTDGVNGLLVPAGEPARWREALLRLFAHPGELERLRAGAREQILTFGADRLGQEALRLFERTIGKSAVVHLPSAESHG